jgi:hypothetical protein
MRIGALLVVALLTANTAAASTPVEEVFQSFDLFGNWAADCAQPASSTNPRVAITMPSPGLVFEDHDLGADYAINRYSVLSAAKLSAERLSIEVIFAPGSENEQRQKLILQIRKQTRRTLFNQPDGGEVRVKDGIALSRGTRTPLLKKCG